MVQYTKISGQVLITWTKIPLVESLIQEGITQIYYNVYRGNSFSGIFYKQNTIPLIINQYIDNALNKNPNIIYWYKISAIYKKNDKWIEGFASRPVQYKINNLNKWFNKMNERNMWILKNDGLVFQLYQRKYEGERCSCFDSLRGVAGNSRCPICWGTSFIGKDSAYIYLITRKIVNILICN